MVKDEDDKFVMEYQLEIVVRGFFDFVLFLDYIYYFVLFEESNGELIKKIVVYY